MTVVLEEMGGDGEKEALAVSLAEVWWGGIGLVKFHLNLDLISLNSHYIE